MKKLFIICILFITCAFSSCQNDIQETEIIHQFQKNEVNLVPLQELAQIGLAQKEHVYAHARRAAQTQSDNTSLADSSLIAELKEDFQSFIEVGSQFQSAIISYASVHSVEDLGMSYNELEQLYALDEEKLAEIGMQVSVLYSYLDEPQAVNLEIPLDKILSCALEATGITNITTFFTNNLVTDIALIKNGTQILISAKTAIKLLRGFLTRYLGWIGIVYMVYDFTMCITDKK